MRPGCSGAAPLPQAPDRYCLSIQLSAVQLGLAIAANPGRRAQSLVDAHRIAEDVLASARS